MDRPGLDHPYPGRGREGGCYDDPRTGTFGVEPKILTTTDTGYGSCNRPVRSSNPSRTYFLTFFLSHLFMYVPTHLPTNLITIGHSPTHSLLSYRFPLSTSDLPFRTSPFAPDVYVKRVVNPRVMILTLSRPRLRIYGVWSTHRNSFGEVVTHGAKECPSVPGVV